MTFESLKEIILATLSCGEEKVAPDAKLVPDVCADSLDTVELAMALEDTKEHQEQLHQPIYNA